MSWFVLLAQTLNRGTMQAEEKQCTHVHYCQHNPTITFIIRVYLWSEVAKITAGTVLQARPE